MKRFPLFVSLILLLPAIIAGISADAAPTLSDIRPISAPNNDNALLTITGSGFNNRCMVWMTPSTKCEADNDLYGYGCSFSPTSITCTFPIKGVTPGTYTVWANCPYTDPNGNELPDMNVLSTRFQVYQGTSTSKTTATTTKTTTARTTETRGDGENSVFFETNPPDATIYLSGNEVGTSTFTYYTNREGVYDVLVKKSGYQDYEAKVVILEGKRVHFYAPLVELLPGNTTPRTSSASGTPARTVMPAQKSTLKIPTPLGTFIPVTEESPIDPAVALLAAGIAIGFVQIRRR